MNGFLLADYFSVSKKFSKSTPNTVWQYRIDLKIMPWKMLLSKRVFKYHIFIYYHAFKANFSCCFFRICVELMAAFIWVSEDNSDWRLMLISPIIYNNIIHIFIMD